MCRAQRCVLPFRLKVSSMSLDKFYPFFPQNCVCCEQVHCYTRGEQCILKALFVGSPCNAILPPLLFGLLASSAIFCVVFVSLQPRLRHNLSHVVLWPRDLNTIIFTQKPNRQFSVKLSKNRKINTSNNDYSKTVKTISCHMHFNMFRQHQM